MRKSCHCDNMNEPGKHCIKLNKPGTERQMSYDVICI